MSLRTAPPSARFGVFEFLPESGELLRDGRTIKLQAQPARVLAVLVARAGEIVARDTLQREVWGTGTHVDFERGLNFCVAQVRSALGDSADAPRYIETVPKQGYRFIAPVRSTPPAPAAASVAIVELPAPVPGPVRTRRPYLGFIAAGLALAVVAGAVATRLAGGTAPVADVVAVIPFYNETGNAALETTARAIGDATVARLAAPERLATLSVIGNAAALKNPFARQDIQQIAAQLGAQWVLIGQLKADGQSLRVIGHLIRVSDMKHVWAQSFDDPAYGLDAQARAAESIAKAISQTLATD